MKKIIGVMGPGKKQATKEDIDCAFEIGKLVAKTGSVLLCGGMKVTGTATILLFFMWSNTVSRYLLFGRPGDLNVDSRWCLNTILSIHFSLP